MGEVLTYHGTIEDYIALERLVAKSKSIKIPLDCPFSFEAFAEWALTQKRNIIVRQDFGRIYVIDTREWH